MIRKRIVKTAAAVGIGLASFGIGTGSAGASTQPVPFSWTFVNTQFVPPPSIDLTLPSCGSGSSWGDLGGGASVFIGSQPVYGNPPGVSPSYTCIGLRLPL